MSISKLLKIVVCAAALVASASAALAYEGGAYLYERDGEFVLVDYGSPDTLSMIARGRMYEMTIGRSASGSLYTADGDARTTFWGKGEAAFITLRGEDLGEFTLVRRYGDAGSVASPTAEHVPVPIKVVWRVVSIEGAAVSQSAPITITFGHHAALTGHSGVNAITGSWITTTRDGMVIDELAATKNAAPQDLLDQEARLLDALGRVRSYRIDGDLLTLSTDVGVILAEKI